MREINKQDIDFLKDLQHEMLTQDNVGQASPRFWAIRELKRSYGIESGYNISGTLVLKDGEEIADDMDGMYEYLKDYIEDNDIDINIEYENGYITFYVDGDDGVCFSSLDELLEFIDETFGIDGLYTCNYLDTYEIVPDTMFLTYREAKEHIRRNHYHYRQPHPYAMTAWRSPQVEKLYEILENVDFDKLKGE